MMNKKLKLLKKILLKFKRMLIAYSGGVDSTFLLAVARKILEKNNVLAVTALSETYPKSDIKRTKDIVKKLDVNHIFIKTNELENKNFIKNSRKRCFYCKNELFKKLKSLAEKRRMILCDGSNFSDIKDFRPGKIAANIFNVMSPLEISKFKKAEIRKLSKKMNLDTWNIPAQACLASRFPYGTEISKNMLQKIEKGEESIKKLGFTNVRLRHHGDIARIEIEKSEMKKCINSNINKKIILSLKKLGWKYISVDIEGYRTGSLNY
ncbi:MAG: ATP-dependent sacrificial sulfur transferase LarE [Elusimicrobia bacterium]|nr:ATP-dependent sacrificial sulfur transferase LarE [Elusimicrobiota bacterium]